jgi:hypothetical protein
LKPDHCIITGQLNNFDQTISGPLQDMLNGITELLAGPGQLYDHKFYHRLINCLNEIEEPRLLNAVDAQWKGFMDYAHTLGTDVDPWKSCSEVQDNKTVSKLFMVLEDSV